MGTHKSKNKSIQIPEFYYIHKKRSRLIHVSNGQVAKLKFSKKIKIRKDCAIGYLPNRKFMVCGGTDSSECLTNKVYIIDPINLVTKVVSRLPVPSKSGHLIEYRDWVYYAGAVSECEDEEADSSEAPAKLMRYSLIENYWEVFPDVKSPDPVFFGKTLSREKAKELQSINISDLLLPTAFLYSGRIYLMSGEIKNTKGIYQKNNKIYSINISNDEFGLVKEKIKLPVDVFNPICISRGNNVLIAGGIVGGEFNKNCWSMNILRGKVEFLLEPLIELDHLDCYPPVYDGQATVLFAFPDILILRNGSMEWEKISIVQETSKPPTLALNKILEVDKKPRNKSPVIHGYKDSGKKAGKKKPWSSDSEEEKINPFPGLETIKSQPKFSEFKNSNQTSESDE